VPSAAASELREDGCDVEEDGDGRLTPRAGVPQNERQNQFNCAATSEREDQDGDCLGLPRFSACHPAGMV